MRLLPRAAENCLRQHTKQQTKLHRISPKRQETQGCEFEYLEVGCRYACTMARPVASTVSCVASTRPSASVCRDPACCLLIKTETSLQQYAYGEILHMLQQQLASASALTSVASLVSLELRL